MNHDIYTNKYIIQGPNLPHLNFIGAEFAKNRCQVHATNVKIAQNITYKILGGRGI